MMKKLRQLRSAEAANLLVAKAQGISAPYQVEADCNRREATATADQRAVIAKAVEIVRAAHAYTV